MDKSRNIILDALKGIAIIAVVLYHFGGGLLPYGYLGVDIFLVVGGYLLIKSLHKRVENGSFHYLNFLLGKIVRLWPLILCAAFVTIAIGYNLMLPDDYENVSESVIAAAVFAENILQCITTKNYWDVVNVYKPLMHLWYIGVLMQAYVVLPLLYLLLKRFAKKDYIKICTIGLTCLSLALFFLPFFSTAWKFYYLPFRIFEITAGGLLLYLKPVKNEANKKILFWLSGTVIGIMLLSRWEIVSGGAMLLTTVVATLVFLHVSMEKDCGKLGNLLAEVGKRSYSIYIWHQVAIAFAFYSLFPQPDIKSFCTVLLVTAILTVLSYSFIESPLGKIVGNMKREAVVICLSTAMAIVLCFISFKIYTDAGVVRDVPELEVERSNIRKNMHSEYCDRPYSWDNDFSESDELKILVIGNSFGRDWANILYEYDEEIDISYLYYSSTNIEKETDRILMADMVFYAMGPGYTSVPEDIIAIGDKLHIIGNKNFGKSNGIIYAHRGEDNYFEQTVDIPLELTEENINESRKWGEKYVDMMTPVMINEKVRVFTDDYKFISQDCRHLTKAGAQYYARILNMEEILSR